MVKLLHLQPFPSLPCRGRRLTIALADEAAANNILIMIIIKMMIMVIVIIMMIQQIMESSKPA